jgi:hypothetical protein
MTQLLRATAVVFLAFTIRASVASAMRPPARVPARPDSFEEAHETARKEMVGRLLALASWCHEKELFEDRDHLWRAVIGIDSDNAEARKGLRYARNVDGSWKEPSPRPAKNRNPAAQEELPAKRGDVIQPFRDALIARFDTDKVPPETRKQVIEEILSIDPDDESAHHLKGEAKLDGAWVLAESVAGKERRAAIKAAAEGAKTGGAKPEALEPADEDKVYSEGWKCGLQSGPVRILGTGDASQCERFAEACRIAGAVFHTALGAEPNWAEGFTLYVVAGKGEKEPFISKIPALSDEERQLMKRTIGGGIAGTWKVALFEPDPARLLDCGVRHSIAHLLFRAFNLNTDKAWIFEGFGLYLTRETCGTRLTWFSSGSGSANEGKNSVRGKLMAKDANWMNAALQVLAKENPPDLGKVLQADLAKLSVDEVLVSYALAAYLIEGRSSSVPAVLKSVGEGTASAEALQSALGMSVPELQARLTQWLKERK